MKIVLSGCFIIKDSKILLLYRKDHQWYETPGGKVNPTDKDLKDAAEREVYEELGDDIRISELEYFGSVEIQLPDKRIAVANKFLAHILSGEPRINEPETFSGIKYLPIENLEDHPLSPDLELFLPRLRAYIKNK